MQTTMKVERYEDAILAIKEIGILPLSPLFPDYPSLDSLTNKADWYTETDRDPWLWRARFPADGVAAYGKFIKKKSILISTELVPAMKALIGHAAGIELRYADGLVTTTAKDLYQLIEANPGIETRALRKLSGLAATEQKKEYDQAITELQAGMDIVISGVTQRLNDNGDKNGWNSTSFETGEHWMETHRIDANPVDRSIAKRQIQDWLQARCSTETMKSFIKLLRL